MPPSQDHITNLPDDPLLRILNLLPSTRQRAATSILSRRWRYLWTRVPSLDFPHRLFRASTEYPSVVERLVRQFDPALNLDRLSVAVFWPLDLNTPYKPRQVNSTLSRCFELGAERSLRELALNYHERWTLPRSVSSCARSLRILRLHGCALPKLTDWSSAERFVCMDTLELNSVAIGRDKLQALLSLCPELENLKVVDCRGLTGTIGLTCTANPRLGNVVVGAATLWKLKIDLPMLSCLYISGRVDRVVLQSVVRLREGGLAPESRYGFHVNGLHPAFTDVESFLIDRKFLEIWQDNMELFTTINVRSLQCDKMYIYNSFTPMFRYLIRCPLLRNLHIRLDYGIFNRHSNMDCNLPRDAAMLGRSFSPPEDDLDFCSSAIETIVISNFSNQVLPMQLVEFLLRSMNNLEQLTLILGPKCSSCEHEPEEETLRKINNFYKASQNIRILAKTSERGPSLFEEKSSFGFM